MSLMKYIGRQGRRCKLIICTFLEKREKEDEENSLG